MATSSFFLFSIFFLCFSMTLSSSSHPQNFTFELIHRDSPHSPLYNPLNTVNDNLNAAYHRSISRSHRFNQKTHTDLKSDLTAAANQFYMNITIGTPPIKAFVMVDTGSDLTWVQCKPCKHCYPQEDPIFEPLKSTTYKKQPCDSRCVASYDPVKRGCDQSNNVCKYRTTYVDKSFSEGDLGTETISIKSASGSHVPFPKTVFGCGYNNGGTFHKTSSGIIGLGGGESSLISQFSSTFSKKFSYCLSHKSLTTDVKSVINLGANSIPSGSTKISTPMVKKEPKTFYYLTLEAISVEKTKIPYTTGKTNNPNDDGIFVEKSGNIVIDSGTPFTFLDLGVLDRIATEVVKSTKGAKKVDDPEGKIPYCFEVGNAGKGLPFITMHFTGADVELFLFNTFVERSEGIYCLSMAPKTEFPIYGSYAQLDFLVGYDLEKRRVSFQRKDCSKSL